jgi:hypothetical protein
MELPVFYSHPMGIAGTSGCVAQETPCPFNHLDPGLPVHFELGTTMS